MGGRAGALLAHLLALKKKRGRAGGGFEGHADAALYVQVERFLAGFFCLFFFFEGVHFFDRSTCY